MLSQALHKRICLPFPPVTLTYLLVELWLFSLQTGKKVSQFFKHYRLYGQNELLRVFISMLYRLVSISGRSTGIVLSLTSVQPGTILRWIPRSYGSHHPPMCTPGADCCEPCPLYLAKDLVTNNYLLSFH